MLIIDYNDSVRQGPSAKAIAWVVFVSFCTIMIDDFTTIVVVIVIIIIIINIVVLLLISVIVWMVQDRATRVYTSYHHGYEGQRSLPAGQWPHPGALAGT